LYSHPGHGCKFDESSRELKIGWLMVKGIVTACKVLSWVGFFTKKMGCPLSFRSLAYIFNNLLVFLIYLQTIPEIVYEKNLMKSLAWDSTDLVKSHTPCLMVTVKKYFIE